MEPNKFPSCLIPCLVVSFTRQLEILMMAQISQNHFAKLSYNAQISFFFFTLSLSEAPELATKAGI